MALFSTTKTCRYCRSIMLAEQIHSEPPMFRKSAPVLICPKCDRGSDPASHAMHERLRREVNRDAL